MYNYKKSRQLVIDKQIDEVDHVYCEYCGRSSAFNFQVHHLVYRSEKPNHKHLHNPLNLQILCNSCHFLFHANKGIRNDIVEERKLYELFGNDVRFK